MRLSLLVSDEMYFRNNENQQQQTVFFFIREKKNNKQTTTSHANNDMENQNTENRSLCFAGIEFNGARIFFYLLLLYSFI